SQRSSHQLAAGFATDRKGQMPIAGLWWTHSSATFNSDNLPSTLEYYQDGPVRRPVPFFATLAIYSGIDAIDTTSRVALRRSLGFGFNPNQNVETNYFNYNRCPSDQTYDRTDLSHFGNVLAASGWWDLQQVVPELTSYMFNEYV